MNIRAFGFLALVSLAACGGGDPGTTNPPGPVVLPAYTGADISSLGAHEQAGAVYRVAGAAGDAVAILHAHGVNLIRLRLFVNPSGTGVEVNDLAYTVAMAQRAKAVGAKLLLDIHYSDTWADPGHQATPAAWAALPLDTLELRVRAYTDSVVTALGQAGALPDIVQIGNEVDAGMLWPLGQLHYDSDSLPSWSRFTGLLTAAAQGVQDAVPVGGTVRVMVQYSQGASSGGTQWFFDHLVSAGVPFDVIGVSYYPFWHGGIGALRVNLQATAERYGRDVMVVETSYPWRAGGWENMVTNSGAMVWPVSQSGQTAFLTDLVAAVVAVPGGHGLGVVWWYPEAVQVNGLFVWGGGSLSLFDAAGNLLPAAAGFGDVPR